MKTVYICKYTDAVTWTPNDLVFVKPLKAREIEVTVQDDSDRAQLRALDTDENLGYVESISDIGDVDRFLRAWISATYYDTELGMWRCFGEHWQPTLRTDAALQQAGQILAGEVLRRAVGPQVGEEWVYLCQFVKVLEIHGTGDYREAMIETRFGKRSVVPVSELSPKPPKRDQ